MPFTVYACACGCPWEGYDTMEGADHDDHEYAWEILQDYIKGKWMDMLGDFFNEARRDTEFDGKCDGEDMFPRTTRDMINMVLEDDRTDFFGCEECSDSTNGARCYRSRPRPKKRVRVDGES